MNEQERAEWLARAVDNLIQRRESAEPPQDLNDKDLQGLMRVARARLDLAETTAHAGLQYEGAVWQKVLDRLESRAARAARAPGSGTFVVRRRRGEAREPGQSDHEMQDLEDVAALRKEMAAEVMAFAETHRDEVWKKLEARLSARSAKKGFLGFLRRDRREADTLAPALDDIVVGQTVWRSDDSRIEDLIEVARKRRTLSKMAQDSSTESERRVWSRLGSAIQESHHAPRRAAWGPAWQRLAAGAAVLALLVAAIGPIPATGLANHPAVRFVESIGDHVGVTESDGPPTGSSPTVLEGTNATAAEASQLLGLELSEPSTVPPGFVLAASLYFPNGLTSESGAFLLSYSSDGGALLVFQEAASGADLAAGSGSAEDITLLDGTPATYFAGGWTPEDSTFAWAAGDAQTLIFDRAGVRTVIQHVGENATVDLTAVAAGLE